MRTRLSRGFTLVEVMISMIIVGVIGGAFTKLLMTQNRYYDHETNRRNARSIARSATNVLMADLRMVQDNSGVDSVAPDGKLIRILVPYRLGVVCGTNGNTTTVSMLPIDSGTVAVSVYRGFAWRDTTTTPGTYVYEWPPNPTTSGIPSAAANPAICTGSGAGQANVRTVSIAGRPGEVLDVSTSPPSIAQVGSPVFFWQRVTYSFRASGIYRGESLGALAERGGRARRRDHGALRYLIAIPLLCQRLRCFDDRTTGLDDKIRGLDLVLAARSPRATSNDSTGAFSTVTTAVFFKNVRAF